MAALLTLLAIIGGVVVGLANGGDLNRVRHFRPELPLALAGGLALQVLLRLTGWSGGWAVALDLVATGALGAFAVANIRIGGMVLIVAGLGCNLLPTLVNWGMPTSRDALVTAGVITSSAAGRVELEGPRHVATDDDSLRWLGETIALPTGQVISFGDVLMQFGYLFVTAAVLRGRRVRRDGDASYRQRIAPLGQGPARRRGPGLHPSRQPLRPGGWAARSSALRSDREADDDWDDDAVDDDWVD